MPVTMEAIAMLAQSYLAGWADHFSASTPVFGMPVIERTRFFRFLRRQYRDHFDFLCVQLDEQEREDWMKDQILSFLGIPPELQEPHKRIDHMHSAGRRRLGNALDNVLKDAGVVPRGKYVRVLGAVVTGERDVEIKYGLADHPSEGGNSD